MTLAKTAYGTTNQALRTNASTEYEVIAQITRRMKAADSRKSFRQFAEVLHDNRQLWTLLAVDVADKANGLPQALRSQIFYLAEFTIQHTSRALAGKAGIEALIDINTAVMRGLDRQGART